MYSFTKNLISLVALFLVVSCSKDNNQNTNFVLTGNIKGMKTGKLYIEKLEDTTFVVVDSIEFNGKSTFESRLKIESPQMLYLFLDRGASNSIDNSLFVFAEPGKMTLETNLDLFYKDAQVTGSENHELYSQYKKMMEPFAVKKAELYGEEIKARKLERPQNVIDSISAEHQKLVSRQYLRAVNFALNNKEFEIAPYIAVFEINDINKKYLDTIYNSIIPEVSDSKYGKMLKTIIEERNKSEE